MILIIGPGKGTAEKSISSQFDIPTIEGDELRSSLARQKMAKNLPLDGSDRRDWLANIRGAVIDGVLNPSEPVIAVTCSALSIDDHDELRRFEQLLDIPVTVSFMLLSSSDEMLVK